MGGFVLFVVFCFALLNVRLLGFWCACDVGLCFVFGFLVIDFGIFSGCCFRLLVVCCLLVLALC